MCKLFITARWVGIIGTRLSFVILRYGLPILVLFDFIEK